MPLRNVVLESDSRVFNNRESGAAPTGESIDRRDDAIAEHDRARGDQVEALVGDEDHPRLDDQVGLVEGNQGHEISRVDQVGGGRREDP